jgi:hypothetical protein
LRLSLLPHLEATLRLFISASHRNRHFDESELEKNHCATCVQLDCTKTINIELIIWRSCPVANSPFLLIRECWGTAEKEWHMGGGTKWIFSCNPSDRVISQRHDKIMVSWTGIDKNCINNESRADPWGAHDQRKIINWWERQMGQYFCKRRVYAIYLFIEWRKMFVTDANRFRWRIRPNAPPFLMGSVWSVKTNIFYDPNN